MRTRIKKVAEELLIRHGYRGLRFRDIATRVGTTRANIHYHFGTKQKLVEEVVEEYVEGTLARFRRIWTDEDSSLSDRIRHTMEFNRERYHRFNRRGDGVKPWSLIARMRLERDLLSRQASASLNHFAAEVDAMVTAAVEQAKAQGELAADAPGRDIALQVTAIANTSGSISQDTGSFDELEQLYMALARVITHAYGRKPRRPARSTRLASAG